MQVFLPFAAYLGLMSGDIKQPGKARFHRLVNKLHPGLLRSSAGFSPVTLGAGANDVLPGMLPAF